MRVPKLVWSSMLVFALFLPLVFAQSIVSNPWIYFTVNTLILWFILFVIFSVITSSIPNFGDKEKTLVQLGAFAIAAVLSWNFVGGSGFIWQVGKFAAIFNIMFLVNTVLVAAISYFIASYFLSDGKSDALQSKTGMWVMALLIGGVMASDMTYYLWQSGSGAAFIKFLFGEQGILTLKDNRLYLFVSGAVLFSWLFTHLQISKESPKLSYFMAVIIAANLASAKVPISSTGMIRLGEWIAIYILGSSMSRNMAEGSGGSRWYVGYPLAIFLVDLIVSTIFPGKAMIWKFDNMVDALKIGGLFVVVLAVVGYFIARAAGRSKAGGIPAMWKDGGSKAWNGLLSLLRTSGILGSIARNVKDWDRPGEYLKALKLMRLETYVLMTFVQRHDVFTKKRDAIRSIKNKILDAQKEFPANGDFKEIQRNIVGLKQGVEGRKVGIANHSLFIDTLIKETSNLINRAQRGDLKDPTFHYIGGIQSIIDLRTTFSSSIIRLRELRGQLMAKNAIDAYRPLVVDVYNLSARRKRGYGFAYRGATVTEVDCRGYSVDNPSDHFNKNEIRPLSPEANGRFGVIASYVEKDWNLFLADFEKLAYHPNSRKVQDYAELIKKGSVKFGDVLVSVPKGKDEIGYDHEALNNPGFFSFQGKPTYNTDRDDEVNSVYPNPYPGVSFEGLRTIISEIAKQRAKDQQRLERYLKQIVMLNYNYNSQSQSQAQSQSPAQGQSQEQPGGGTNAPA